MKFVEGKDYVYNGVNIMMPMVIKGVREWTDQIASDPEKKKVAIKGFGKIWEDYQEKHENMLLEYIVCKITEYVWSPDQLNDALLFDPRDNKEYETLTGEEDNALTITVPNAPDFSDAFVVIYMDLDDKNTKIIEDILRDFF